MSSRLTNSSGLRTRERSGLVDGDSLLAEPLPQIPGPVGYWEYSPESATLFWSEEVRQIHGIADDIDVDLDLAANCYQPDERELFSICFRRAVEEGENFQIDLDASMPEGPAQKIRLTGIVRRNDDGTTKIISGFCQIVTEQVKRDQELLALSDLLEQAEELGGMGYWVFDPDKGQLRWSNSLYAIHGIDPATPMDDKTALSYCHPDDRATLVKELKKLKETDKDFSYQLRLVRQDGEVRHVRSVGSVLMNKDGSHKLLYGLLQDITAERETRETLSRSEAMFSAFVDNSPSAILIKDTEGKYLAASRKWHEWFNPEGKDINEKTVFDFYPKDHAEGISAQDQQVIQSRTSTESRYQTPLANGQTLSTLMQKFPVLDDNDNVIGVGGINIDLSEIDKTQKTQARLLDALENISDGYAFYDSERRLIYCNGRYKQFYPWVTDLLKPGVLLDNILQTAAQRRQQKNGFDDAENWVRDRLALFEQGAGSHNQVLQDGRVVLCNDSRSEDGGYVSTRTDITELKRAESELQTSNTRFRHLFDTAVFSIWDEDFSKIAKELDVLRRKDVTDLAQYLADDLDEAFRLAGLVVINDVNDATLALYGVESKPEFINNLSEIMNENTIQVFVGVLVAIWNKDDFFKTEATHQTFDGREITIFMSFPIPNNASAWQHVPVCIIDITDQKKAETELQNSHQILEDTVEERTRDLRASEEKLRDLIDGSLQGIMVHQDLRPLFVNDVFAEIHGYTTDEFMALKSMLDLLPLTERERLAEYGYSRTTGGNAPTNYEYQALRKDGQRIWLENKVRQVHWDGQKAHQSTIIDITERKKAEEALIESERLYRSILETSPIGMGITNAETGIPKFVNDSHLSLLGATHEEYLATPGRDFWLDPRDREGFVTSYRKTGHAEGVIRLKRKDGTTIWVVQRWERNPLDEGETLFWTYDISKLKETQEQMMRARDEATSASQAKTEFLSSMSHELRTPLNAILGFSQLLQSSPDDPLSEDHLDSVDHIIRGGQHLLDLVNDVLDFARIETGSMTVSIEPVALAGLLDDCRILVASRAAENNIAIEGPEKTDKEIQVQAESTRLKQVVLNLLTNAIKYNRDDGRVTLAIGDVVEGKVRISISDTGIGISEENKTRIFDPFDRVGAELSDIEGTGIGLTITRELVELMNGSIGVDSTIGEGSTFWFELPVAH